jgi:DNA-binding response OmpR family regulator
VLITECRTEKNTTGLDQSPGRQHLPDLRDNQPVLLIAYGNVLIRNLVTIMMQSEGYSVLSASDGHEALELSRKYPGAIDLVLTDVIMPRLNCIDLCSHLLQERPGIKVLVMSSSDLDEIVSHDVNLPFLPKPLDGEMLKARVRAILDEPVQSSPYVYMAFWGGDSWTQQNGLARPGGVWRTPRREKRMGAVPRT